MPSHPKGARPDDHDQGNQFNRPLNTFEQTVLLTLPHITDLSELQEAQFIHHVRKRAATKGISEARALQEDLLAAIAALDPQNAGNAVPYPARRHKIIRGQYVDRVPVDTLQRALHMSGAQYKIEHDKAVQQMAVLLRERWGIYESSRAWHRFVAFAPIRREIASKWQSRETNLAQSGAAALICASAAIHLAVTKSHFEEWFWFGIFFLVLASVQFIVAVLIAIWPWHTIVVSGIAITLSVLLAFYVAYFIGIPIGPNIGEREDVTPTVVLSKVLELASLPFLFKLGWPRGIVAKSVACFAPRLGVDAVRRWVLLVLTAVLLVGLIISTNASRAIPQPAEAQARGGFTPATTPSPSVTPFASPTPRTEFLEHRVWQDVTLPRVNSLWSTNRREVIAVIYAHLLLFHEHNADVEEKLISALISWGDEARASGQTEEALVAYEKVLVLQPGRGEAKERIEGIRDEEAGSATSAAETETDSPKASPSKAPSESSPSSPSKAPSESSPSKAPSASSLP